MMNSSDVTDIEIIEKEKYQVDDLLETFNWIGKTALELNIDEKYMDSLSIDIVGKIFNAPAEGSAWFDPRNSAQKIFDDITIYVYCDDLSFPDCLENLEGLYGEAVLSGEEPYVEANGGAVEWYDFNTGKGTVHISAGMNNNFYTIRYKGS